MKRIYLRWLLPAVMVLSMFAAPQVIQAEEPMFAIRLVEGGDRLYAVGDIEQIGFETNNDIEELVVVLSGGMDHFPVEGIARIDFVWDLSGVDNPEDAAVMIDAIRLFQNQPNPFSPETKIRFEIPEAGRAELTIYDVSGRLIRTLVKDERRSGAYSVAWDGLDDSGRKVSSGVYFYSLRAPGVEESRRMILLP
ncbi:MAG: T9SS type A sorting domain-containing protein [Candidatus Eisenbacteria bacterium]|uniref:T9SS type A sorting domain-containing protein n=1 Tax=Eiseniibacteriota bacterium TaxID=2212470 RepID=A0A948WBP2_UNCEI|nr:T9SS type A sorting domain-containing protein [Candidatus Eisenbacteria bacterium]MBU1950774.1 T9SS type A sorting domain-containing protein [Candidatus Eisenbacteria bacterium]MBU2690158.1 T9SS type A sorting domain-containing protein [Candidatus Eisenbacteria bacterium]